MLSKVGHLDEPRDIQTCYKATAIMFSFWLSGFSSSSAGGRVIIIIIIIKTAHACECSPPSCSKEVERHAERAERRNREREQERRLRRCPKLITLASSIRIGSTCTVQLL